MLSLVADRRVMISLVSGVQINVGKGIQKEVRLRPSFHVRFVVIIDLVGIEQLAGIVCVVTSLLQPHREVLIVQSLTEEFRITTYQ